MIKIILTDEKGNCYKFYLTKDMELDEILECIEKQFYPKEPVKPKRRKISYRRITR